MSNKIKLKNCPFCGKRAIMFKQMTAYISVKNEEEITAFGCNNLQCVVRPRINVGGYANAISQAKIWNTRQGVKGGS